MPSSAHITDAERGLTTRTSGTALTRVDLGAAERRGPPFDIRAVFRIATVAEIVFRPTRRSSLRDIAFPSDPTFVGVLVDVYQSAGLIASPARRQSEDEPTLHYISSVVSPHLERAITLYRADLAEFVYAVQRYARQFATTAVGRNRQVLQRLEEEFLRPDAVESSYQAALAYVGLRRSLFHGVPAVGLPPVRMTNQTELTSGETLQAGRRLPDPDYRQIGPRYRQIEQSVLQTFADSRLQILFAHPQRESLISRIAVSPLATERTFREVFAECRAGLHEFLSDLAGQPESVWRYPPILAGAVAQLVQDQPELIARASLIKFVLNLAEARAGSDFGGLSFVAGTAVLAVSFVWGPLGWALAVLLVADTARSALAAYADYRAERQNDLLVAAGTLGHGIPLTNRPSNYGPAALEAAAAVLSAVDLLHLRLESALETSARLTREAGVVERSTSERGLNVPAGKRTRTEKPLQVVVGSPRRGGTYARAGRMEKQLETFDDFFRLLRSIRGHELPPLGEAEAALFRRVTSEQWEEVLTYARSNAYAGDLAIAKLAGKIQEVTARQLPQYVDLVRGAGERIKGLLGDASLFNRLRWVRDVRTTDGKELTDGVLALIRDKKLYLCTILESKSRSNLVDLVPGTDRIGQFVSDITRMRETSIKIGGPRITPEDLEVAGLLGESETAARLAREPAALIFEPHDIVIEPKLTEFVALTPSGSTLSDKYVGRIRQDVRIFRQIESPVRDHVLVGIAANMFKLVRGLD